MIRDDSRGVRPDAQVQLRATYFQGASRFPRRRREAGTAINPTTITRSSAATTVRVGGYACAISTTENGSDNECNRNDQYRKSDCQAQWPCKIESNASRRRRFRHQDTTIARTVIKEISPPIGGILPLGAVNGVLRCGLLIHALPSICSA